MRIKRAVAAAALAPLLVITGGASSAVADSVGSIGGRHFGSGSGHDFHGYHLGGGYFGGSGSVAGELPACYYLGLPASCSRADRAEAAKHPFRGGMDADI